MTRIQTVADSRSAEERPIAKNEFTEPPPHFHSRRDIPGGGVRGLTARVMSGGFCSGIQLSLYRFDDLLKRCRIPTMVFIIRFDNCLFQLVVIKTSVTCDIVLLAHQRRVPLIDHIEIAELSEPPVV